MNFLPFFTRTIGVSLTFVFLFGLLVVPATALAQDSCPRDSIFGCLETDIPGIDITNIDTYVRSGNPIVNLVSTLAIIITGIVAALGLIMVVVGGYVYMTAGGDASRVAMAKSLIMYALLGIVLAVAAFSILNVISPQFTDSDTNPREILQESIRNR